MYMYVYIHVCIGTDIAAAQAAAGGQRCSGLSSEDAAQTSTASGSNPDPWADPWAVPVNSGSVKKGMFRAPLNIVCLVYGI